MPQRYRVCVAAGTLTSTDARAVHFPHRWTPGGVTVEADFTGGHLLHLAAAGCILNDLYREATALGIELGGARVSAAGGFDTNTWASTGVEYTVEIDSHHSSDALARLLEIVDTVAEIPRALRAGVAVDRTPESDSPRWYGAPMDAFSAAERWARTWARAWPARDAPSIAQLYAPHASYRSHPHREPEPGGALAYTNRVFAEESAIECRFGVPIASGGRAAVEWWAGLTEGERELTLSGTTLLTFDDDGLVVDHVDYWVVSDGRLPPSAGWNDPRVQG